MFIFKKVAFAATISLALFSADVMAGETVTITDITGREVEVSVPVERVILGEGRQIYFVAALDTEAPFKRVVGWRDDFRKADLDGYNEYLETFPQMDDIPTFGGMKDGTFNLEQAIELNPDVIIMNTEAKSATQESGYIEKLAKVGIPLVYIDFREKPIAHTDQSMRIIGKLLGKEARAEDFVEFRQQQMARVTDVLDKVENLEKPLVFVERAGGYSDDCCMSFGNENFGKMVEMAGGENMAGDIIPGTFGTVNPEQIIASDPDQIVITGANWENYVPSGNWVGLGAGADNAESERKLKVLMQRPAFTGVKAVKDGNVHGIWHQFYNSPYQFIAVQQLAKWLHPDLFQELDPSQTFADLHEKFLPVEYRPGYFASLNPAQ
ncbi:ABC transporter substrate-binding protein [Hoeflea ulvae]|uniref:ABC transporter substrate-binding protein n=1 Tax=Hoeflea ulvae TaxID=2983764 RepID=A0ABT3YD64_9HYPH|nr:ABC transporter substrate-binding protein [Hoeflea ulvae]MCY0093719.1 ABC transporter substrate-binding protein [Hoeflea ulvae]